MKHIFTCLILISALVYCNISFAQCDPPSTLWEEDGTIINWIAKDEATSHVLRYRVEGTFNWTEVEIENNSFFDISFLESCETYDFRVRSICGDDQSSFTPVFKATANCGTCHAEYCQYPLLNDEITSINYFELNDYVNESTVSYTGYEDFRGTPEIVLNPGQMSEIEIRMNEDGFFYENLVVVFIDFNRDQEFTPDEVVLNENIEPFLPATASFQVPDVLDFGITRIRVVISSFNYDADACDDNYSAFWGEVEEYCALLGELPSACDFEFDLSLEEVNSGEAVFEWDELEEASAYNFRYKKISEVEWNENATDKLSIVLEDLEDCTEYEFQIRGVCPFDTSAYKNSIVFNSFCSTDISEEELLTDISTYPNPWSESLTISVSSLGATELKVVAYDLEGRRFEMLSDYQASAGQNEILIQNTSHMAAGIYMLEIINDSGQRWMQKAIKIQ